MEGGTKLLVSKLYCQLYFTALQMNFTEMRVLPMAPNKLAFGSAALIEGNTILEVQTCAGPIKSDGHFFCFLIKIGLAAKVGE